VVFASSFNSLFSPASTYVAISFHTSRRPVRKARSNSSISYCLVRMSIASLPDSWCRATSSAHAWLASSSRRLALLTRCSTWLTSHSCCLLLLLHHLLLLGSGLFRAAYDSLVRPLVPGFENFAGESMYPLEVAH